MGQLRWSAEAATWLEEILRYIAQHDPDAALRLVKGIYVAVQTLREFPRIGYVYRTEAEGEVRVWPQRPLSDCLSRKTRRRH